VPIGLKGQNEKLLQAKVSKSRKFYAQVAYQSVPAEIIRIHKKKCISNFQKNDDKDCSGNVDLGSINETIRYDLTFTGHPQLFQILNFWN